MNRKELELELQATIAMGQANADRFEKWREQEIALLKAINARYRFLREQLDEMSREDSNK